MKLMEEMNERISETNMKRNILFTRLLYLLVIFLFLAIGLGGLNYFLISKKDPVTSKVVQENQNNQFRRLLSTITPYPSPTLYPSVIPSLEEIYPYYYADKKAVWRKNSKNEEAVLIFSSTKKPAGNFSKYFFKLIHPNLVVTAFYDENPSRVMEIFECNYSSDIKGSDCKLADASYQFGFGDFLIESVPGEPSYIYLKIAQENRSSFGSVFAQMPFPVDVMKRNYAENKIEKVAQIEQRVGCGGGSWHANYYHGYKRDILVTSNKMILLQLGCEGYPGQGNQYVIDVNQKKIISGNWDFISPVEIDGGRILFHRITSNQDYKKRTHSFFTASINNPAGETQLFDFGPDKYVTDLLYDKQKKQAQISYIYTDIQKPPHNFDLRIAVFNPNDPNLLPTDIYMTKGYYIDNMMMLGQNMIYNFSKQTSYCVSSCNEKFPAFKWITEVDTYFLDKLTNISTLEATGSIVPANSIP